jgi:hypothetical protein
MLLAERGRSVSGHIYGGGARPRLNGSECQRLEDVQPSLLEPNFKNK